MIIYSYLVKLQWAKANSEANEDCSEITVTFTIALLEKRETVEISPKSKSGYRLLM